MAKKPPLTKKKQRWVGTRTTAVLGTQLNYNVSYQLKYQRALLKLVRQMTDQVKREVTELFRSETAKDYRTDQKEVAAMDGSISSKARILMNQLTAKFQQLFNSKAKGLAESMVKGAEQTSQTSLTPSLKQLSGGLTLQTSIVTSGTEEVSTATVAENVSLIKSIPQQYLKDVTGSVMRSITGGNGISDLIKDISKYNGMTERRAKNIALDQTRKAYNSINKQKMMALGVKKYKWIHSYAGQYPRQDHIEMNGNIYSFDDPPIIDRRTGERGIPGQAINCRCTMIPVIEFEDGEQV